MGKTNYEKEFMELKDTVKKLSAEIARLQLKEKEQDLLLSNVTDEILQHFKEHDALRE
ncbi:hypothetical protein SAMN04487770_12375 [Butyrivibrio sp. ob235]|uniref:hypothetical protein n=1 Tax=Butyrivibrio sp. ob235 TaxID=1761780 RepID=UPI0008B679DA|nr:hypothetical protein [Butyrivibrio sp. ob235]SEM02219.1 hypothetical protein SAMN04487770_12375 [Butyrivibrio sp. ob235]